MSKRPTRYNIVIQFADTGEIAKIPFDAKSTKKERKESLDDILYGDYKSVKTGWLKSAYIEAVPNAIRPHFEWITAPEDYN